MKDFVNRPFRSALVFWCMCVVSIFALPALGQESTLQLFDVAPPLEVQFVKGKPVTLAEGRGERVYVVEFWATWCAPCKYSIPHLTSLQEKFGKDGLVVVGISDETLAEVQPFIAKQGDKMEYRVAIDKKRATTKKYFGPFKNQGIPWAVVIDKAGRIMWTGHPMDPIVPELVEVLLEEEYVPETTGPPIPSNSKESAKDVGSE